MKSFQPEADPPQEDMITQIKIVLHLLFECALHYILLLFYQLSIKNTIQLETTVKKYYTF